MEYRLVTHLRTEHEEQLYSLFQKEWWTRGRTLVETRRMLASSRQVFGFVDPEDGTLAGFARVLSDGVFKALILDLIVAREHRGRGLGQRIMRAVLDHPDLRGVRDFELYCLPDMEPFYEQLGFSADVGGVRLLRTRNSDQG